MKELQLYTMPSVLDIMKLSLSWWNLDVMSTHQTVMVGEYQAN